MVKRMYATRDARGLHSMLCSLTNDFHQTADCKRSLLRIAYDSPPSWRKMSQTFWHSSVMALYQYYFTLPRDSLREISRTWYEVTSAEGAEFSKRDDIYRASQAWTSV